MSNLRAKLIRLAASMPKGSSEKQALVQVLAGNSDTAWSFEANMGLWVSVSADGYKSDGKVVSFNGKADFANTTGSEQRLGGRIKGIPFTATYDLAGDDFSVSSKNELFERAISAACVAAKGRILRDLRNDEIIP